MSSVGNYKWMNSKDTKKSKFVDNRSKRAGNLMLSIAINGKTRRAFKEYK